LALETSVQLSQDFSGQPIPKFKNGYLVAYNADRTKFFALDRNGVRVAETDLTALNLGRTSINDVAASAGGFAIAATIQQGDKLASAILLTTSSGQVRRVITTAPFAARRIIYASDGSLWASGRVHQPDFEDEGEYTILRRYDSDGVLSGSFLQKSSLFRGKGSPSEDSYLVTNGNTIGFLSITAGEWVALGLDGTEIERAHIALRPEQRVTGAAMDTSGKLFLSLQIDSASATGQPAVHSMGLYFFDKAPSNLQEVATDRLRITGQGITLMGNDGDRLVLRLKPPQIMAWVRPL
jgi:hypothetical protein